MLLLWLALGPARAAGAQDASWTGVWETRWRDGGARLSLQQDGTRVTGSYIPYEGRIEGLTNDNLLVGR